MSRFALQCPFPRSPRPARARAALLAAAVGLAAVGCAEDDGAWTTVDDGLLPAQLRVVATTDDGGVFAAGYHPGRLAGVLLEGRDGLLEERLPPADVLRDHAFVDLQLLDGGVLWVVATCGLFRVEDGVWQRFDVPAPIVDGVTDAAIVADGFGWVLGQSWEGPRIYRFEDGAFTEEAIVEMDTDDVTLVRVVASTRGFGYAAGARRTSPQEAVLIRRTEEVWVPVELPLDATQIGPLRDLVWHADGAEIWAVGDMILQGDAGSLAVVTFPYDEGFTPRVAAFPGMREGWIAGFGAVGLVHERFGEWFDVGNDRLAPSLGEGVERTWLFDDASFPSATRGWLVASWSDCDADGACHPGQSLLRYDRDDTTRAWRAGSGWARPADEGRAGPELRPTAVATSPDGTRWLAGDAEPVLGQGWGRPELWQRGVDDDWRRVGVPAGVGIHGLWFDDAGAGWAVGSESVEGGDQLGAILQFDGVVLRRETVEEFVSADWELRAVAEAPDGTVYAVGRRHQVPLVMARVDGVWQVVSFDDAEGSSGLTDLTVLADGTVWAVGNSADGFGGSEGYLLTGDAAGMTRVDVSSLGRSCGPEGAAYPCWSLEAVASDGATVFAVGESTALRWDGEWRVTDTNMTLIDVAFDDAGQVWALAENGWWIPDGDGWRVERHFDPQLADGIGRRLIAADDRFDWVAGYRERSDVGADALLHSVVVEP